MSNEAFVIRNEEGRVVGYSNSREFSDRIDVIHQKINHPALIKCLEGHVGIIITDKQGDIIDITDANHQSVVPQYNASLSIHLE